VQSRSSSTTWLAAAAGGAAVGIAAAAVAWPVWLRGALALWGAFVLVTGIAGRVTALVVSDDRLVVRRALLPDRAVGAAEIRRVVPPRWPLGAWRIEGGADAVTLMPSDLRGAEAALATVVRRAGLRFRSGAWLREA
jgi:hypothetical protein